MSNSDIPVLQATKVLRIHRDSDDLVASLKRLPEDFVVIELWQPEFSGEGEHLYLHIEKTGQNTPWVAQQLAKAFRVPIKTVGYSGLKDRQAIAHQWFSLPVPAEKSQIDPEIEGVSILKRARHSTKLRRGTHAGNHFKIRLRELEGNPETAKARIEALIEQGFPNYFGLQRFGHNGNNLRAGMQLSKRRRLVGHPKRGIYLSAMRSALFNRVLTAQIEAGNWPEIAVANSSAATPATGPMWGRGRPLKAEIGTEVESQVLTDSAQLCDILEHGGLSQDRRPLVQHCPDLSYSFEQQDLLLEFSLPPGSYATVLIDEIVAIRDEKDQ